jgi:hypothetical protein
MALRLASSTCPSVRFRPVGGRARAVSVGVVGALVLAVAGCGAQTHPNDQRPSVPTRVAVTITPKGVTVAPDKIAMGPERGQQIPQNANHPQPPIKSDKGPLDVVIVAANQTTTDSHLEITGPTEATSGPLYAQSPGSFQTQLPAGEYTITAADLPRAKTAKLVVGKYRASSQNDVLLP